MCTPARQPVRVDWLEAPARILALGSESGRPGAGVAVVGITGPVGAGKSTLARLLSACVVSTDNYLPDYHTLPEHEHDEPRHMDAGLLLENLAALRAGRVARVPVWSFQTHRREGMREVLPPPPVSAASPPLPRSVRSTGVGTTLIVVEGIHALHESVAVGLDVRVYVDAPATLRWRRWEELERSGQRGWGVEKAHAFFHDVAEPTFARHAETYRARADVVVVNDGG